MKEDMQNPKGEPALPAIGIDGFRVMGQSDVDEYIEHLSNEDTILEGAEGKILDKARVATARLQAAVNTVARLANQLEQAKMELAKAEGEQQGHIRLLVELEDDRRAACHGPGVTGKEE